MDTAMPLQLLQPLDSNNPASTPVHLSGPEQRLIVTPDPGAGDESLLPPRSLSHITPPPASPQTPSNLPRS